jgi:hypothetical protein
MAGGSVKGSREIGAMPGTPDATITVTPPRL